LQYFIHTHIIITELGFTYLCSFANNGAIGLTLDPINIALVHLYI